MSAETCNAIAAFVIGMLIGFVVISAVLHYRNRS